ncbi:MAG: hypothetical protein HC849_25790 [Oscillatoriales cyanobacterium RU_3_3]|nr:hypothetical protein [Oscillatoriales cyanobacterium RU_3_3]
MTVDSYDPRIKPSIRRRDKDFIPEFLNVLSTLAIAIPNPGTISPLFLQSARADFVCIDGGENRMFDLKLG